MKYTKSLEIVLLNVFRQFHFHDHVRVSSSSSSSTSLLQLAASQRSLGKRCPTASEDSGTCSSSSFFRDFLAEVNEKENKAPRLAIFTWFGVRKSHKMSTKDRPCRKREVPEVVNNLLLLQRRECLSDYRTGPCYRAQSISDNARSLKKARLRGRRAHRFWGHSL